MPARDRSAVLRSARTVEPRSRVTGSLAVIGGVDLGCARINRMDGSKERLRKTGYVLKGLSKVTLKKKGGAQHWRKPIHKIPKKWPFKL